METKMDFIHSVQTRVANCSIGASTLRGQGSGLSQEARKFLAKIKLEDLSNINLKQFEVWLDTKTEALVKKFLRVQQKAKPERNWGAARKSINIFLENAFYDRFLCTEYSLYKLEGFLELPFDSNAVAELKKDIVCHKVKHGVLPKWDTIIRLESEEHRIFQEYAASVAENKLKSEKYKSRIYLDLYYWRTSANEKKDSNH